MTNMLKWIMATLLVAATAVAQQTHKEYEPPNPAGAGQRLLAQYTGEWDLVKSFFPMNGKPIVTKGTCKQYMIQDGKFLQSDFTFFNPNRTKSTGTGISGFDSTTNRFTTVWYDSHQTIMSIRQSDGTFDGKNIVLWATALDPDRPGRKTVSRTHLEEDGHVLLHRHFLIDDKGQVSELVRGRAALFLTKLEDEIVVLDPAKTELVADTSSHFNSTFLYLEAQLRRSTPCRRSDAQGRRSRIVMA